MIETSEKSSASILVNELLTTKKELIYGKKIMDKKDKHIYPIKNTPFKTPINWQWVFLSDISIIQEGPGLRKHQYQDEGIQFLTVTNILEGSVDLLKSQKHISLEEYEEKYKHYTINKGDIVVACSGATWGKSAIYESNAQLMLNTSTLRLRFFNDLGNNKYLYFLTKSNYFKANLASHSTGQQPNYGYSHYSKIPIPIPPIQEQKQIVAILDKAFTAIDQAKANIEKNIVNAKELFQSKLNAIFSQKGEGWEEKTLGEIANVNYGYTDKSTSEGDFRYIRITDIDNNGELDKSGKVYVKTTPKSLGFILNENDLLMARTGATFAKVLLYKDYEPSIFASYLIKISFTENISNELYWYFTKSGYYWEQANNLSTGSAQPHFNGAALKKLKFSYPTDTAKQLQLIEIIKGFDNTSKEIISLYSKKLNALEELKKSILQKAFSGELTQKEVLV